MPQRWVLSDETSVRHFMEWIGQQRLAGKRPVVEIVPERRTIDQNSLIYALYADVSRQVEDRSPLEVRCETKALCGVPILLTESQEFREKWVRLVKDRFTHEEKVELMSWFPVTSLMSKAQLSQYLERMVKYWAQQGVYLELPEDAGINQYPEAAR